MSDSERVHSLGTYLGAETIVDESDVDLIEIKQRPDPNTIGGFTPLEQVVVITPEMATKLREILIRRHAEGRE